MHPRYLGWLYASSLLLLAGTNVWAANGERLFGVIPQYSPQESARQWQPLLDHLSMATGIPLRFATASRITRFQDRVLAGDYDYVYLNSLMYRELHARFGYRALARASATTRAVLVARHNGPRRLAELTNRALAFPAPSAVATVMIRADLDAAGVAYQYAYVGTHESVYRAVASGEYVAGAGVDNTLAQLAPAMRRQLTVLHRTDAFVSHVIAVHPRVPPAEAERLQRALLAAHTSENSRALLKPLGFDRLVALTERDLDAVRRLAYPRPTRQLSFHVLPRLSEADTRLHMLPITAYVRQRLELEMVLKTYTSMAAFDQAIRAENGPALINANPTQALDLIARGYRVLAQQLSRNPAQGMQAVLLVRTDSPYRLLTDLRGKRVAFGGGPNAFFASIVPRVMLKRAGLHGQYQDASAQATGAVAQVLQQLHAGMVDAVAIGTPALQNKRLRQQYIEGRMRVLARSDALPGLAWLASPTVDADTREALRHLLLNFGTDAPGHAELAASGTDRLVAASNATYAPVAQYLRELAEP